MSTDFEEIGDYTISTEIWEGECSQVLTHTVAVSNCNECYCECWEEANDPDSNGEQEYILIQEPIDCNEDCAEIFDGDPIFDCVKKIK